MGRIRDELKPLGWDITETNEPFRALGLAMRTAGDLYEPITGVLNAARPPNGARAYSRTSA